MRYDVAVIGGGASGLVAAITAAERGLKTAIFEKNSRVGKKLLATGNGKCNILPLNQDISAYNDKLAVERVFSACGLADVILFFKSIGLPIHADGGRYYPLSNEASTVLNALREKAEALGINVFTGVNVTSVKKDGLFRVNDIADEFKKVIISIGSDAGTGTDSTGLLSAMGHNIIPFLPALSPIITDKESIRGLKGIRTKAAVRLNACNRLIYECAGEIIFKDNGVSGTAVFDVSSALARLRNIKDARLHIDFLPDLDKKELIVLLNELNKNSYGLDRLFHKELARAIRQRSGGGIIGAADTIKNYVLEIEAFSHSDLAQVMCGGADLAEFDLKTMESLIIKGLFATGEALNADGVCGGYNLLWAWATGIIAGRNV